MEFDICYPIHLNETEISKHFNALRTARVLAAGLSVQRTVETIDSGALRPWSLTEVHLKSCQRYSLVAHLSGIEGRDNSRG
jgi:hypothetical protein